MLLTPVTVACRASPKTPGEVEVVAAQSTSKGLAARRFVNKYHAPPFLVIDLTTDKLPRRLDEVACRRSSALTSCPAAGG